MKRSTITLHDNDGDLLGVYTSISAAAKGVDYWRGQTLGETLYHYNWSPNEEDNKSWDWSFIAIDSTISKLTAGGCANIPRKNFWGKNLMDKAIHQFRYSNQDSFCYSDEELELLLKEESLKEDKIYKMAIGNNCNVIVKAVSKSAALDYLIEESYKLEIDEDKLEEYHP